MKRLVELLRDLLAFGDFAAAMWVIYLPWALLILAIMAASAIVECS